MAKIIALSDNVLNILKGCVCAGNNLRVVAKLARPDYVEVNKVLEAMGGKWNRKEAAHVFADDAADLLASAVMVGHVVNRVQTFQYFPTPDALADRLANAADVRSGHAVLEPSCGDGALLRAIYRRCSPARCVAVELDADRKVDCDKSVEVVRCDFLTIGRDEPAGQSFDRVVMNPPFSGGADCEHVAHAFTMLRQGGKLAAIMSPGFTFRAEAKYAAFRELLAANDGEQTDLPAGAFSAAGTEVRTVLVTITKS